MRRLLPLLALSLLVVWGGCQSPEAPPDAAAVIDSARVAHGAPVLDRATVTFNFRGDDYRIRQDEGRFHYQRTYTDSLGRAVIDGLTNDGVYRVVNGDTVSLSDEEKRSIRELIFGFPDRMAESGLK